LNHCIVGALKFDFPACANDPTRDEVVIVRVERTEETGKESFILESRLKGRVSENLRAIGCGTSGDDENASVDVAGCSDFEVVAFEVETADEVPEALEVETSRLTDNTLVCTYDTNLRIFEGREDGGEEVSGWPEDGRVDPNHDLSLDVWHGMADLHALVAFALLYDADLITVGGVDWGADFSAECKITLTDCGNDDRGGVVSEDCAKAFLELWILWARVGDWDNDCAVTAKYGRFDRSRNGLVQPEENHVDNQTEISPDEEGNEPEILGVVEWGEKRQASLRQRYIVVFEREVHGERKILEHVEYLGRV
jgi:hypothetical protein